MYCLTDIDLEEVIMSLLMMVFTLCETIFSNSDINSIFFVRYSPSGGIGLFTIKSFTFIKYQ